jgi:hypothetical protein
MNDFIEDDVLEIDNSDFEKFIQGSQLISYLQLNDDGVAVCYTQAHSEIDSPTMIRVDDNSNLGKKWDGEKFSDLPARYKVWSKTEFVTLCGRAVFDAVVDGTDKDLRYFKYVLDSSAIVDLNVPAYFGMVKRLNDIGVMSDEIFDALTARE